MLCLKHFVYKTNDPLFNLDYIKIIIMHIEHLIKLQLLLKILYGNISLIKKLLHNLLQLYLTEKLTLSYASTFESFDHICTVFFSTMLLGPQKIIELYININ